PSDDLSRYRMVIVPSLYLLDDPLPGYQGRLVVTYLTGLADRNCRVRWNLLRERLGIRIEELRPLAEPVTLSTGVTATRWSEVIHLEGAESLADYPDGSPAITRYGDATYISTRLTDDALARLLR
ncbi:MAG: beta-galactosidase, partial [Nonomuraea sp.]|nr:beta-galactosidase [Nonomuraea sp.]